MLCADDIPLYDVKDPVVNKAHTTRENSGSSNSNSNSMDHEDDDDYDEESRPIIISLRDFRTHKNDDKVAATTWATTLLHSLEPPGGGQIPPGCLLPFAI